MSRFSRLEQGLQIGFAVGIATGVFLTLAIQGFA